MSGPTEIDKILAIIDVGLQQTFEPEVETPEGWCGPGVPIGGWLAYYEQWGIDIRDWLPAP